MRREDVRKELVPAQVKAQLRGNINGGVSCLLVAGGRGKEDVGKSKP